MDGLEQLDAQFSRIGKMPKKYLRQAAASGMANPLREARATAPVGDTGVLKKSIHKKQETPNKRNKAVYRLRFNPKYSDHFRKPSSGAYGGKPPTAYYPHSVEYGFKLRGGKKKRGKYFVSDAIEKYQKDSLEKVVKHLNKSITQLMNKP